jgi:hypothetical protein
MQNIFGLSPYLGDAHNATNLNDLFVTIPGVSEPKVTNSVFKFTVTNLTVGKTTYIQASTNFSTWVTLQTNVPSSNTMTYSGSRNLNRRFYRVQYAP